ncbi:hypothetical protein C4577_03725, partial [Candidatus Parcubacteria bacterium]
MPTQNIIGVGRSRKSLLNRIKALEDTPKEPEKIEPDVEPTPHSTQQTYSSPQPYPKREHYQPQQAVSKPVVKKPVFEAPTAQPKPQPPTTKPPVETPKEPETRFVSKYKEPGLNIETRLDTDGDLYHVFIDEEGNESGSRFSTPAQAQHELDRRNHYEGLLFESLSQSPNMRDFAEKVGWENAAFAINRAVDRGFLKAADSVINYLSGQPTESNLNYKFTPKGLLKSKILEDIVKQNREAFELYEALKEGEDVWFALYDSLLEMGQSEAAKILRDSYRKPIYKARENSSGTYDIVDDDGNVIERDLDKRRAGFHVAGLMHRNLDFLNSDSLPFDLFYNRGERLPNSGLYVGTAPNDIEWVAHNDKDYEQMVEVF